MRTVERVIGRVNEAFTKSAWISVGSVKKRYARTHKAVVFTLDLANLSKAGMSKMGIRHS